MLQSALRLDLWIVGKKRAAIRIWGPEARDAGHRLGFVIPPAPLTAQRGRAWPRTMERTERGQNFVTAGQHARELDRVFVRLRAARGVKRATAFIRPGRHRDQRFGEFRATILKPVGGAETESVDLGVHRVEHGRMSVAEIGRDESG